MMQPGPALTSRARGAVIPLAAPCPKSAVRCQAISRRTTSCKLDNLDTRDARPAATAAAAAARGLCAGLAALLLAAGPAPPADAVLAMPRGQLPRTAEIALRRSVPAFNPDVKEIQDQLEDIALKLRIPQRKPWGGMAQSLEAASKVAESDAAMLAGVLPPYEEQAKQLVADIRKGLVRLSDAVAVKDPDRTSLRVAALLKQVSDLELLQAPGLPYNLPRQYATLPRLTGRAVVELTLRSEGRPDPESVDPEAPVTSKLRIVLDGYSAPITAGNFVANIMDGLYNGARLTPSFNSIFIGEQEADPAAQGLPLEVLAAGDFEPQYRAPLDIQGGERPVLPLSINGALAMAKLESGTGSEVSAQQFFIYKFRRSEAGLAGLSFDEGQFGVFGYVTQGADALNRLGSSDVIVSAKLLEGADKLVRPAATVATAQ